MNKHQQIRVLSVGQCSADEPQIRRCVLSVHPALFDQAHSTEEALEALARSHYDLVLINRVFDATGEEGLTLIGVLKGRFPNIPTLLVSNYPDAQAEALSKGASPGFGKNQLYSGEAASAIQGALTRKQ